jgi:hypothetical protein
MKGLTRMLGKRLDKHLLWNGSFSGQRRTFVTQTQRRRAVTASAKGLGFPIVDHSYEYVAEFNRERGRLERRLMFVVLLLLEPGVRG